MRVLHTESSKGWGGQENRTLNELIGLRELGHEMAVVAQPGARILDRAGEAGFPTFSAPMRNALDLPGIMRLRGIMREFAADVVNTHSGRDTQLAGLAARSLGLHRPRIVRTRHLALPITSRFTYSRLVDHVVTVSRFVADYLVSAGVPRGRISTVHTGIDFDRYQRLADGGTLRRELGLDDQAMLVGTVAILRFKKGHAEILDTVPTVLKSFPNAHFLFAGDGPMHETLAKRIESERLGDHVHLLGLRRDVVNVLQSLDLFVLPTHQEALGTAFVEAAAMGLPAIGTRIDGIPEVIVDSDTGLLVPPRDSAALARAIMDLLGDRVRRETLGDNARHRVARMFSRQAMAAGMVSVYERMLEHG